MWIKDNKIWDNTFIIYNGFKYFHPSKDLLKAAGYRQIKSGNNRKVKQQTVSNNIQKRYEDAVQRHIDRVAEKRGYTNGYTCLSYIDSTDQIWKRQANIFNSWRDSVWHKCHEILKQYQSGEIEQPTIRELINLLPKIEW